MTKSKQPVVSVIISTCDRKECLKRALESLRNLNYPNDRYEIIVVDDGSKDGTHQYVNEILADSVEPAIHYHRQARSGVSAARNNGINRAKGELLVISDDDCTFEPDWLDKLVTYYDSPAVGVIGGPDKGYPDASILARCIDYAVTSFAGTGGVRKRDGLRLARYYPKGCNMAVPKAVITKTGGFDETLAAGEDIDLSFRIRQQGHTIRYAPEAFVWHKRRDTIKSLCKQIFTRGYTRVELARRHRELLEFAYLLPACMVTGFMLLAGLSLRFPSLRKVLRSAVLLYAAIVVAAGLQATGRIKDVQALILTPLVLVLQHTMYGLGFLGALLKWQGR